MTDVACNSLDHSTELRKSISDPQVNKTGVCLCGYSVTAREAGFSAEDIVEQIDLVPVVVEDLHERGW